MNVPPASLTIVLDDTIIGLALREALGVRGLSIEPAPPWDARTVGTHCLGSMLLPELREAGVTGQDQ